MRLTSCRFLLGLAVFSGCLGYMLWPLPGNGARADGIAVPAQPEEDQETARRALEKKEILPLGAVLARVESAFTGDVVEIELERQNGLWVYAIEIIDTDGRVRVIHVDGKTADVLTVEFEQ
jgi:uncharacterized membrane protein YkoI